MSIEHGEAGDRFPFNLQPRPLLHPPTPQREAPLPPLALAEAALAVDESKAPQTKKAKRAAAKEARALQKASVKATRRASRNFRKRGKAEAKAEANAAKRAAAEAAAAGAGVYPLLAEEEEEGGGGGGGGGGGNVESDVERAKEPADAPATGPAVTETESSSHADQQQQQRYTVMKIHKIRGLMMRTLVLDGGGHFWTETGTKLKRVTNTWEMRHNFVSAKVCNRKDGVPCRMELVVKHGLRSLDPLRLNVGQHVKDVRRKRTASSSVAALSTPGGAGANAGAAATTADQQVLMEKKKKGKGKLGMKLMKLSNSVKETLLFELGDPEDCAALVAEMNRRAAIAKE